MVEMDIPAGANNTMEGCSQHSGGNSSISVSNTNYFTGPINNYAGSLTGPHGDKQAVAKWLASIKDQTTHKRIYQDVAPNTGLWFLETDQYRKWEHGEMEYLWATAMGGAGKTYIFSVVVNHLRKRYIGNKQSKTGVSYFYCRFGENHSIVDVLSSLLQQLFKQSADALSDFVQNVNTSCLDEEGPSEKDLVDAIGNSIKKFDRVFILLDGLDELSNQLQYQLVNTLRSFGSPFLITSRMIGDFGDLKPNTEIKVPSQDFRRYMEAQIRQLYKVRTKLNKDNALVNDLMDIIETKSDGMFLIVALHLSELKFALNISELRQRVEALPDSINGIYEANLSRIDCLDVKPRLLARRALLLVTHACRPLTTPELLEALAVRDDSDRAAQEEDLIDEAFLLQICCGLLHIEADSNTVRLMHYTTQAFFEDKEDDEFKSPNQEIASICLSYLRHRYVGCKWKHPLEFVATSIKHPFMSYALSYLGTHARGSLKQVLDLSSNPLPGSFPLMRPYLDKRHRNSIGMTSNIDTARRAQRRRLRLIMFRNLFLDSSLKPFELTSSSDGLRNEETFTDEFSLSFQIDYGQAVHFASLHGILPVVENLSDYYATQSEDGRTALHYAVIGGHTRVVNHLLKYETVDVNHRSKSGQTPLSEACLHNNVEMVRQLLQHGQTRVDIRDSHDMPLLHCAIFNSCPEIVEELLSRQALRLEDNDGLTILFAAFSLAMDAFVHYLSELQDSAAGQFITSHIDKSLPKGSRGTVALDLIGGIPASNMRQTVMRQLRSSIELGASPLGPAMLQSPTESAFTSNALDLAPANMRELIVRHLHSWMGITIGPQERHWSPPPMDGHERQLAIFKLVLGAFGIDEDPTERPQVINHMLRSLKMVQRDLERVACPVEG